MIYITITQSFGTVENLITELNTLPEYNRDSILEVKTWDGWRSKHFMYIDGTFEYVILTASGTPCRLNAPKNIST